MASASPVGAFGVSGLASARYFLIPGIFETSFYVTAAAEITRSETILSEGPIRPGFALVDWILATCGGGPDDGCVTVVRFGNDYILWDRRAGFFCSFTPCNANVPALLPITLGTTMDILTEIHLISNAGGLAGGGTFIQADLVGVHFTLYEQDRETEVGWAVIPEPSTWILSGIGVLVAESCGVGG